MTYTLDNIREESKKDNPVKTSYIVDSRKRSSWKTFVLEQTIQVRLSNGMEIMLPYGFMWDKSSTPRILWWLMPPFGNFEIAALIHDYLYVQMKGKVTQKFADKEMYLWSKAVSGTRDWSWYNIDNKLRYWGVRVFGWLAWNDIL